MYEVRPLAHWVGLFEFGLLQCVGMGVLGGPGDERCGEGTGAAGGHLVWSVVVAVISPCTPAWKEGPHVQSAT